MLRHLGGGCQVPIAAHAIAENDLLHLTGVVADLKGEIVIRAAASGSIGNPETLGAKAAEDLLRQGARAILESIQEVT